MPFQRFSGGFSCLPGCYFGGCNPGEFVHFSRSQGRRGLLYLFPQLGLIGAFRQSLDLRAGVRNEVREPVLKRTYLFETPPRLHNALPSIGGRRERKPAFSSPIKATVPPRIIMHQTRAEFYVKVDTACDKGVESAALPEATPSSVVRPLLWKVGAAFCPANLF
jgi:hypothetical protein